MSVSFIPALQRVVGFVYALGMRVRFGQYTHSQQLQQIQKKMSGKMVKFNKVHFRTRAPHHFPCHFHLPTFCTHLLINVSPI